MAGSRRGVGGITGGRERAQACLNGAEICGVPRNRFTQGRRGLANERRPQTAGNRNRDGQFCGGLDNGNLRSGRSESVETEIDGGVNVRVRPHAQGQGGLRNSQPVVHTPVGGIYAGNHSWLDVEDESIAFRKLLNKGKVGRLLTWNPVGLNGNVRCWRHDGNETVSGVAGDKPGDDNGVRLIGKCRALLLQIKLKADVFSSDNESGFTGLVAGNHLMAGNHAIDDDLRQRIDNDHDDDTRRRVKISV